MLRIVGLAFVAAVIASIVSDGNQVVIGIAFFGVVVLFAWSLLSGRTALKCPACGKRVKLGYPTCHHCGAQVAKPRGIGAPRLSPDDYVKQCEHCMSGIHPESSVCPNCQRDVERWTLHEKRWWMRAPDTGEWAWLDDSAQWRLAEPGQSTPQAAAGRYY